MNRFPLASANRISRKPRQIKNESSYSTPTTKPKANRCMQHCRRFWRQRIASHAPDLSDFGDTESRRMALLANSIAASIS